VAYLVVGCPLLELKVLAVLVKGLGVPFVELDALSDARFQIFHSRVVAEAGCERIHMIQK